MIEKVSLLYLILMYMLCASIPILIAFNEEGMLEKILITIFFAILPLFCMYSLISHFFWR